MQISSKFTVAVHILAGIALFDENTRPSSANLAGSIGVNPVIVRNVLSMLKASGIVETHRGSGENRLARLPEEITLYDIYMAVELIKEEGLFRFHEHPNPNCAVGRNIHAALDGHLHAAQQAMENSLRNVSLAQVIAEVNACMQADK